MKIVQVNNAHIATKIYFYNATVYDYEIVYAGLTVNALLAKHSLEIMKTVMVLQVIKWYTYNMLHKRQPCPLEQLWQFVLVILWSSKLI